ncbi:hypothetical protein HDE_14270 [Halotydeus destructor]|nr:hypothetical protein HDE_14270 [Halotydeus destructor]
MIAVQLIVIAAAVVLTKSSPTIKCSNGKPQYHDIGKLERFVYVNPSGKLGDIQDLDCSLIIKRGREDVSQLRITFKTLNMAQPTESGVCDTDIATFMYRAKGESRSRQVLDDICGTEPSDRAYLDGRRVSYFKSYYVPFVQEQLRVKIKTSGSAFPRRFILKFTPVMDNSHLKAPDGCDQYFVGTKGTAVHRTLNYPFGSSVRTKVVSCFASGDSSKPLKSIDMMTKPIANEDDFLVGPLEGAQQGDACATSDRIEMSSPSVNGKVTTFCGSRFGERSDSKPNSKVTVNAEDGMVKMTFVPGDSNAPAVNDVGAHSVAFRFVVNFHF